MVDEGDQRCGMGFFTFPPAASSPARGALHNKSELRVKLLSLEH
jgi:hypothetical protein